MLVHRYLRALAAMYIRMTFRAVDVYEILEPLLKDYRKLRQRGMSKYRRSLLRYINLIDQLRWILIDIHRRIRQRAADGGASMRHNPTTYTEAADLGGNRRHRST